MIQFWRILIAGGRNFMRNAWLSTAATAVMTITLSFIIVSFISNSAFTNTIKNVTDKIDISIYLNDKVTPDQRDNLQAALEAHPNTESVNYTSKEEAVAAFKAEHAGDAKLLQGLEIAGNALPASFQVKAKDPKELDSIISIANREEFKPLLDPSAPPTYSGKNKRTIDNIVRVSNFLVTAGLVASCLFLIISTLIIFNTIRMAIFTRRDEIEIMKLVGATKWFIRGPFIFEAALYGIVAAIIAASLSYTLLMTLGPKLNYIDMVPTMAFFQTYSILIVGAVMLVGIFIGAFSSILAMSRYLKL
jgi:cell division transport system permease protein